MKFLINPDTKTAKFLSKVMELFFLNLLFLLTSLPLVTIFTGILALHTVTRKMQEEEISVVKEYLFAFKANLKQGIIVEIILVAVGGILFFGYTFLGFLPFVGRYITLAGLMAASLLLVIELLTLPSYLARYKDNTLNALKVCFQIALMHLKNVGILFVSMAMLIVLIQENDFFFSLLTFLLFLVGFSGLSLYFNTILLPVFAKYERV